MLLQESHVVFWTHAFEEHAQKVIVGLQDSLRHRVALGMFHTIQPFQYRHETIVQTDFVRVSGVEGLDVHHLDMAAEAHHLVSDGMLESQYDTHGDNHHG